MREVRLTIDGKEVQLTDEQLKALGIEKEEKRKNPFERLVKYSGYYRVTDANQVDDYVETFDSTDNRLYDVANYFNDEAFAEQVALHQLLYRKLLKFAYDNGFEDIEKWNGLNQHWYVFYNYAGECFNYYFNDEHKSQSVYFSSPEGASRAIKEVVEPFMKEHPNFVW